MLRRIAQGTLSARLGEGTVTTFAHNNAATVRRQVFDRMAWKLAAGNFVFTVCVPKKRFRTGKMSKKKMKTSKLSKQCCLFTSSSSHFLRTSSKRIWTVRRFQTEPQRRVSLSETGLEFARTTTGNFLTASTGSRQAVGCLFLYGPIQERWRTNDKRPKIAAWKRGLKGKTKRLHSLGLSFGFKRESCLKNCFQADKQVEEDRNKWSCIWGRV